MIDPGDVLVIDGGGDTTRALVGEIIVEIARTRGAAGMVIDGAVRDATVLAHLDFPVFARAAIHRGPYKNGPGRMGVPVSIGGMVVHPGDVVVGDEDGIVAFSPTLANDLIHAIRAQEAKEEAILRAFATAHTRAPTPSKIFEVGSTNLRSNHNGRASRLMFFFNTPLCIRQRFWSDGSTAHRNVLNGARRLIGRK